MADLGHRSIEVVITKDTHGDLTIQAARDHPDSGAWVDGEKPSNGTVLKPYSKMRFGVKTDDVDGGALASFELSGHGSLPIQVDFFGHPDGTSSCSVSQNNVIQADTTPGDPEDEDHTVYMVRLFPAIAPHKPPE